MDGVSERGRSFGEVHFGAAALGDARRTRRLVAVADRVMSHPGGTLPQKMGGWSELMGLYRLVGAESVTHASVIAAHCARTRALAEATPGVVLRVHDTTELDYTHVPALAGQLGQVGNGHAFGYLCHNTLAVTPDRRVLGLFAQVLHRRRRVPAGEGPKAKRDHPGRESRLWLAGCEAAGPTPPGCAWVEVADRGADTFEFVDALHAARRQYVVRCARDRTLAGDDHVGVDRVHRTLLAYARDLPTLGERAVVVPRQQKTRRKAARPRRVARVRVAAGPASVAAPAFARGACRGAALDLWVVHAREVDAPAGVEPLEWVLLTNVPAGTFERACERVDWYACRPVVEELHKGMKTGCRVESMQFEDARKLEPMIALLSVVAAALLQLRQAARRPDADARPATDVAPALHVKLVAGWRYKDPRRDLSVREFHAALAKLGGHLNRKGDGPPGWLTLWRGWERLQLMALGAEALRG